MSLTILAGFMAGLALLVLGAELLVRGASRLAVQFGISPLVIGLTVVAFGTSAPELAVSVQAALNGQPDVALGNVVGSNIANVLFILGVTALVAPLVVSIQLIRLEVPLLIGVSVLLLILAHDGRIGGLEGPLLLIGIVAYTGFAIRQSRKEGVAAESADVQEHRPVGQIGTAGLGRQIVLIAAGLAMLVLGAHWFVGAAVAIARVLGLSELVIGLTIVAAGTSAPELATSVVAALRGERDIAVGNVIGSCLFNILAVTGIAATVAMGGLAAAPALVRFDIPVMIAVAIACLPIFVTGHRIDRWEGALFLGYYAAYVLYLFLAATSHAALPAFSGAMLWFVLPLTAVTLIVILMRQRLLARQSP